MQQRRGTASQWVSANTVLTAGELGYETDTGQFKIGDGTTAWLTLPYFKDTLDLDIAGKAPINSPTFTGTVVLPSTTSIGDVSSSELAVLNNLTSTTAELNILDGVTADASELNKLDGLLTTTAELNTLVGITATTTELNYTDGVTSAIQTQLNAKAPTASPTFTGTVSGVTKTHVGLANVDNTADTAKPVSTAQQTALDLKANLAAPTFTGTVVLPSTTSIGNVTSTEIGYVDGVTSAIQTQLDAKLAKSGGTMTGAITLSGAPTSDLHAATKLYVDNVTAGLNFHEAVHSSSVNNLAVIYNNGTSGVGATLTADTNRAFSTIDGESVAVGQRVLIKDQTDQKQNGIYTLTTAGSVSVPWVLTRATDADNNPSGEMKTGDFTFVTNGTTNAGYGFVNSSTASPIVIGTDNITYTAFNAAKTIVAGNGLTEATPGTLSIDTSITQTRVSGVTDTEIGYLDGVSSAIQTQLNARISKTDISAKGAILVGTGAGTYSSQTVGTDGQVLTANSAQADGVEWTTLSALPSQTGNSGKYLTTNGSAASWATVNATPALDDLTDVTITSSTTNDVVYYNGTTWVNKYVASIPTITNAQTGTTYTLVLGDAGKIVEVGNASAITLTIPTNGSVAYPVGTQITILQTGAGQITVTGPSGGTLNATPGTKLRAQWSSATLLKRATDTWVLIGDLTA